MAAVIPNRHNMSIDGATFMKGVAPIGTGMNVLAGVNGDVTLDQVHDEIFESTKGKPSAWEDQILLSTTINTDSNTKILSTISSMGKCVKLHDPRVLGAQTQPNEGLIPYTIPDNRVACYIRDCFSGTGIPGLNNIFDQATMSLKSFIEYHNRAVVGAAVFGNPLAGYGGLGQQLYAPPAADAKLKYTAYFNYDLLMFVYITRIILQPNGPQTLIDLRTKVINAINGPAVLLTPAEIETINIININYLWCKLMIYCVESLRSDSFLTGSLDEYLPAMNKLTQIRFESFAKNGDNYFTNPIFGYRGNNPVDITQNVTPETLTYIDSLCTAVYTADADPGFGSQMNNSGLSGGVQYVTTQSMVAQAMTKAISKRAGIIARNANNKDPIQNACANEIDKLFKHAHPGIAALSLLQIARGWSMVKFSGDSSHIVFGEIMEAVQSAAANGKADIAAFAIGLTEEKEAAWKAKGNTAAWAADNGASHEGVFYLFLVPSANGVFNFKIVYLIEERPLTARLLAAQKNIFVEGTKLIMDTFTGFGSEDKYDRHAALYIEFDLNSSYVNILTGLQDKIQKYVDNNGNYPLAGDILTLENAGTLAASNLNDQGLRAEFLNHFDLPLAPGEALTQDYLRELSSDIANLEFRINFDLDTILLKLEALLDESKIPNYNLLADTLVGKGFPRMSRATNWKALMIVLQSTNIDAAGGTPSSGTQNGYYDMKEILSIISKLYNDGRTDIANPYMNRLLTNTEGLLKVLNKMVSSFESVRTIADIFSRDKIVKYDAFIQDRIAEWMQDKSGESPPSKIELMVNGLKEFVDLCLDVRAKYKSVPGNVNPALLGGGIDDMINDIVKELLKHVKTNQYLSKIDDAKLRALINNVPAKPAFISNIHRFYYFSIIEKPFKAYIIIGLLCRYDDSFYGKNKNFVDNELTKLINAKLFEADTLMISVDGLIGADYKLHNTDDGGTITRSLYIEKNYNKRKKRPLRKTLEDDDELDEDDDELDEDAKLDSIVADKDVRKNLEIVMDAINILTYLSTLPLEETVKLDKLEILNVKLEDIVLYGNSELTRYNTIRMIVSKNIYNVFADILSIETATSGSNHTDKLSIMIRDMYFIRKKLDPIDKEEFYRQLFSSVGTKIRMHNKITGRDDLCGENTTKSYAWFYSNKSSVAKSMTIRLGNQYPWIRPDGYDYDNEKKAEYKIDWLNGAKNRILMYVNLFCGVQYTQNNNGITEYDFDIDNLLNFATIIEAYDNRMYSRNRVSGKMSLRDGKFIGEFNSAVVNAKALNRGGKKTRRKRHIQTKTTQKLRYVTKTAQRKKTKNANRSKTRRKRQN